MRVDVQGHPDLAATTIDGEVRFEPRRGLATDVQVAVAGSDVDDAARLVDRPLGPTKATRPGPS